METTLARIKQEFIDSVLLEQIKKADKDPAFFRSLSLKNRKQIYAFFKKEIKEDDSLSYKYISPKGAPGLISYGKFYEFEASKLNVDCLGYYIRTSSRKPKLLKVQWEAEMKKLRENCKIFENQRDELVRQKEKLQSTVDELRLDCASYKAQVSNQARNVALEQDKALTHAKETETAKREIKKLNNQIASIKKVALTDAEKVGELMEKLKSSEEAWEVRIKGKDQMIETYQNRLLGTECEIEELEGKLESAIYGRDACKEAAAHMELKLLKLLAKAVEKQ